MTIFWLAQAGLLLCLNSAPAQPIFLKSDASTLTAVLWVTNQDELLIRLDSGDTSGLTFGPTLVGPFGSWAAVPSGAPAGTEVINIPPGAATGRDGQHGFFKVTFNLAAVGPYAFLTGRANVDDYGRVFLNGHPISPSLNRGNPNTIDEYGSKIFSTTNAAWFQAGLNELVISDWNSGGGPSGAAFYAVVYPGGAVYWSGGQGDWSDASHWTPAPPSTETVAVLPAGSVVSMDVPGVQIGGLVIEPDGSLGLPPGARLTILTGLQNRGTLTIEKDGVVAGPAPRGPVNFMQQGGVTIIKGVLDCGEGSIDVKDGDFKVESDGLVGHPVSDGGSFTQTGGSLVVDGIMNLGNDTSFIGGTTEIWGLVNFGAYASSPGDVTVTMTGIVRLRSGSELNIGPILAQHDDYAPRHVQWELHNVDLKASERSSVKSRAQNQPAENDLNNYGMGLGSENKIDMAGTLEMGNEINVRGGTVHITGSVIMGGAAQPPQFIISGGDVTIDGDGVVGLSPDQPGPLHAQLSGGSLRVQGQLKAQVDQQNGTLSGSGTLDGNLISDDGTISPGASPGTLTITSNFIQNAGSTLLIEVAGAGTSQFDQLRVGGGVQLGGTLAVWLRGGYVPPLGEQFSFLSCTNVSGVFTNLDVPGGIAITATNTSLVVTGAVTPQGVFFADPRLEDAVIVALGLPPGPLAETNLQTLTSLDAPTLGITNLTGLAKATGLQWLNLSENQIAELAPLAGCTSLTHLYFEWNQVTNLEVLSGLTRLRELRFSVNDVASVAPLAGCTNLTHLYFEWNQVTNLEVLSGLTRLRELRFSVNDVASVAPLAGCTNLTLLYFENNQIADIAALAGMTQLRELRFSGNPVSSLAPLAGCTNLTLLYFEPSQVSDLGPLAGMTQLRELRFSGSQVSNLAPLAGCTNLTLLYFENNQVADLAALAGMTRLRELRFSNNRVGNLAPLAGCTALTLLYLDGNRVAAVEALAGMTLLQDLRLARNNVQSIGTLTNLPALTYVGLDRNYLDLRPGSAAMQVIAALQARATVNFEPQNILMLSLPTWFGEGQFGFTLAAPSGTIWRVWTSSNLVNWERSGYVTNVGDVADYFDSGATNRLRFYRVAQP